MSVEDLKKRKQILEDKNKYNVILNFSDFTKLDYSLSREKLISLINTDETIHKCELMFEEAIEVLIKKNVKFDEISLISSMGIICKEEYIKNYTQEDKYAFDNKRTESVTKLAENVLPNVVPVIFFISTGNNDLYLTEEEKEHFTIYGLIDIDDFISKMKELGYKITDDEGKDIFNYNKYIHTIFNSNAKSILYLTADLKKDYEINKPKRL